MSSQHSFIYKLFFQEEYLPFAKWVEVIFWGDEDVQKLIEFYLSRDSKRKNLTEQLIALRDLKLIVFFEIMDDEKVDYFEN